MPKTVTEHIRERIERHAGLIAAPRVPPLDDLRKTEWSDEFETLMRNRLLMGAFRYGLMKDKIDGSRSWAMLQSMRSRLTKYEATHNLEMLVDVANLCLLEYLMGKAKGFTMLAVDDGEHVQELHHDTKDESSC